MMYVFGKVLRRNKSFPNIQNCVRFSVSYINENVRPFENIPTARSLPFVGTSLDLLKAGSAPQLHKYIDERHKQLGPIFREKLGPINAVFLASPSLMRSVFLFEGQYPTHPLPEAWLLYNVKKKCRRGLFFMDGEEWLHNRRIMNQFLLSGNIDWIIPHIEIATRKLTQKWIQCAKNKNGFIEIDNLEKQLYRWSIDVLIQIMFGNDFDENLISLEDAIETFSDKVHKIFESSSKLMNFPPKIAKFFNLKRWTEFEKSVDEVLESGNAIMELLIQKMPKSNGLFTRMQNSNMNLDDIKRIFLDLIIAAGDTTAFSTQWALYVISSEKCIQNNIYKQINSTVMNEEVSYLRGLIRETLRLYPVAPFIGRFLAFDAVLDNYKISKNTLVLLSLYTSGRDENSFPNPLAVKPERWTRNKNGELTGVHHANGTLPFAIGGRSCIGRKIALGQMHSLIKNVIENFEINCLNKKPADVVLRLVAVPDAKIRIAIKLRNL